MNKGGKREREDWIGEGGKVYCQHTLLADELNKNPTQNAAILKTDT